MPAKAKLKLFISYGREEITNDFAVRLLNDLKKKGWEVFLDVDEIPCGANISRKIADAIDACHGMIIIFTEKYGNSEWCKKELEHASSKKKKLFPLRRENVSYSPLLEFQVGSLRWLDVYRDDQYDGVRKELIETLEKVRLYFS